MRTNRQDFASSQDGKRDDKIKIFERETHKNKRGRNVPDFR